MNSLEAAHRGRPCHRRRASSDPSRGRCHSLQLQFEQKLALYQSSHNTTTSVSNIFAFKKADNSIKQVDFNKKVSTYICSIILATINRYLVPSIML